MCVLWHICSVQDEGDVLAEVRAWFLAQVGELWPVALGSLSLRRSPCIRKNCHACATGEKHASYVLYVRRGGKRTGLYVPDELVPQMRAALLHGRKLEAVMMEVGVRVLEALRDARGKRRAGG